MRNLVRSRNAAFENSDGGNMNAQIVHIVLQLVVIFALLALCSFTLLRFHRDKKKIERMKIRVISLRKKNAHLETLVTRDVLTGLLNRRGIEDVLARLYSVLSRNKVKGNNFAVFFLDTNGLKNINDTYGHDVGDRALVHFSQLITGVLRGNDSLARIGGDEFVVVVPECSSENIGHVKRKILEELRAKPFNTGLGLINLNTAIGSTMALLDDGGIIPLDKILKIADVDMYRNKISGRKQA